MYKNNITAGVIGTLIEWADFTCYGYLVYLFSQLFFSMLPPELAIVAGFVGFAISYLARPLGGMIFGHIGDKYGRRNTLAGSIFLMGFVTMGIGLLPTTHQIGLAAPILLLLLRFLQGLFVSGESSGAAVFIIEHCRYQPYLTSSWVSTSSAAGMLIGSFAAAIVSLPDMPAWAWRVPFCLGGLACFIGFYIRRHLAETIVYQNLSANRATIAWPVKTLLIRYYKPLLQTAALGIFIAVYIYICNIWWVTYLIKMGYFNKVTATLLATTSQASVVLLTPFAALLAERWGDKIIMRTGLLGSMLTVSLLFLATQRHSLPGVLAVNLFYAVTVAAVTSTMYKYLADLFPAAVRYSGMALGWSIGVSVFGGSAPLIAEILFSHHLMILVVIYVSLTSLLALWAVTRNATPGLVACEMPVEPGK